MDKTYLDKLKEKRQETAAQKKREAELNDSKKSVDNVAEEVAKQGKKSLSITKSLAKTDDVQKVADSINQLNLTTFLASKDNWVTVVDDISKAADHMQQVVNGLNNSSVQALGTDFKQAVKTLQEVVKQVKNVRVENDKDVKEELKKIREVLSDFDLSPVIKVATPKVSVPSTTVDLKPLQNTLDKHFQAQSDIIDLSCYRAQDLDEEEIGVQFVGFVNPTGEWYIIRNDETGNTLRYKFGKTNYAKAWQQASGFDYKLLNEAIRETQA